MGTTPVAISEVKRSVETHPVHGEVFVSSRQRGDGFFVLNVIDAEKGVPAAILHQSLGRSLGEARELVGLPAELDRPVAQVAA